MSTEPPRACLGRTHRRRRRRRSTRRPSRVPVPTSYCVATFPMTPRQAVALRRRQIDSECPSESKVNCPPPVGPPPTSCSAVGPLGCHKGAPRGRLWGCRRGCHTGSRSGCRHAPDAGPAPRAGRRGGVGDRPSACSYPARWPAASRTRCRRSASGAPSVCLHCCPRADRSTAGASAQTEA